MLGGLKNRSKRIFRYGVPIILMGSAISVQVQALEIKEAYVRLMPPGAPTTAVFGKLHNDGKKAIRIISAKLQGADKVEIHAHTQVEGMMKMRKLENGLILEKGSHLSLAPGGYHLMVFGFNPPQQQSLPLKLTLSDADGKAYEFQVSLGKPSQGSAEFEQNLHHKHQHSQAPSDHGSQANYQTHQHTHQDAHDSSIAEAN
jgi:copper(I)-binding protein